MVQVEKLGSLLGGGGVYKWKKKQAWRKKAVAEVLESKRGNLAREITGCLFIEVDKIVPEYLLPFVPFIFI